MESKKNSKKVSHSPGFINNRHVHELFDQASKYIDQNIPHTDIDGKPVNVDQVKQTIYSFIRSAYKLGENSMN